MRILFVGIDLNRIDMLQNIEPATKQAQCFFLENFTPDEVKNSPAHQMGRVLFWKDYEDAFVLLEKIKPNKVIFQLIDNYYHFALFYATKNLNIPNWYMDHGIRFEHELLIMDSLESRMPISLGKKILGNYLYSKAAFLKNTFFRKTAKRLDKDQKKILLKLFNRRSVSTYGDFMSKYGNRLQPDKFIVYSPETFSFYKLLFKLPKDFDLLTRVFYVGIPSLDSLSWLRHIERQSGIPKFLFIDQALHEQNLMGWTKEKKILFLSKLSEILKEKGIPLMVKPHPWNDDYYKELSCTNLLIVNDITENLLKDTGFAASFNSTLLLAFCAAKNIRTFCFEMNPHSTVPEFSYGITKYKVARRITSFKEFEEILENINDFPLPEDSILKNFIDEMLYIVDGNSKTRLNEVILNDKLELSDM